MTGRAVSSLPRSRSSMGNRRTAQSILWIEGIGFSLAVLMSWMNSLLGLPQLLFGGVARSDWRESALESIVILAVWLIVFVTTKRILRRFRYLEEMLQMCGWCRKLNDAGEWKSLEEYCVKELGVDISHGICPNCGRKLIEDAEAAGAE